MNINSVRRNSYAVGGAAWGDEGKGKIVDEIAIECSTQNKKIIAYRVNGGPNAGHTIEKANGERIALHQLPSAILIPNSVIILGKGMVIHPADLIREINSVKDLQSSIKIDKMAALALDTHRAYEGVLKSWQTGGSKGATGRGIAPAYSDIILRQPMQLRDLLNQNWDKFEQHYDLYSQQIAGLGQDMAEIEVATAIPDLKIKVGTKKEFINRLKEDRKTLAPLIEDVYDFVKETWQDEQYAYIFEMAQAIGLDPRFGVYPDITGSDTTFASITASTEGTINYEEVEHRILTMKATYSSSVGVRKLPTDMTSTDPELANKIREDAWEYGATTKRPRDIVFLDLPAARFYSQHGGGNEFAITHMDVVYPNTPIKICTDYQVNGKIVAYRPDQEFLNTVTPIYKEIPTWDQKQINLAKNYNEIPKEAKDYVDMIAKELGSPVTIITNGPKREQIIKVTK